MSSSIGITLGDPAGIGPEITAKTLLSLPPEELFRIVIVGDRATFERAWRSVAGNRPIPGDHIRFAQIAQHDPVPLGRISIEGGKAAYQAVARAVDLALASDIGCIVTAPLNKAALNRAGYDFDGHTGLLAHLTGRKSGYMLLASERLNTIHVSTHVSLRTATERATAGRIVEVVEAARAHFVSLGITEPRIAVAGLNPHCGEGGLFGDEEMREIAPGIALCQKRGWNVSGPISGDTVFHRATKGEFDVVVAQYHDQGHIPIKLIAFDTAVNVTLGLPIKRTSVDHGTAFDIAGSGKADATNMGCAIAYAFKMLTRPDEGRVGPSR